MSIQSAKEILDIQFCSMINNASFDHIHGYKRSQGDLLD